MEDALEQLSGLARKESRCTRCSETAARRLRAVPGGGHPHAAVMIVSLTPSETDEAGDGEAGAGLVAELAAFMPALKASRDRVYVTTLLKCVPRGETGVRPPAPDEMGNCFDYLSREISITTPHYILAVGEETTRFVLARLFRDRPYAPGDALELRVFDNPAFKVVPVATPEELRARDAKEQRQYRDRLRRLAHLMGI
jgi:uracil-DNA glycosylase family 4